MMKLLIEYPTTAISFWIDPETGSLCVQYELGTDPIIIPYNTAQELLTVLRQKQAEYIETNQKGWGWIWKG
jgi:hypothetical protein